MGTSRIPVDLLNPGQVFACLGLVEAVETLSGPTESRFEYEGTETQTTFLLSCEAASEPVKVVLSFLADAEVVAWSPHPDELSTEKWSVTTVPSARGDYPIAPPDSPATLVAELQSNGRSLTVEHWGDSARMGRDNVKFWAGSGGYPGAALLRDAIDALREPLRARLDEFGRNPFALALPQSSSFRFDWRKDYVPLDAGFSPNEHANLTMVGYPLVDVLAALGLTNARPERPSRQDKLRYRYGTSNAPLPALYARAVLGGAELGFATRRFGMRLDWPGKEDQARCITDVREEFSK